MHEKKLQLEFSKLIANNREKIIKDWVILLTSKAQTVVELMGLEFLHRFTTDLIDPITKGCQSGNDILLDEYKELRNLLKKFSQEMTIKSVTPSETALFLFYFKEVVLDLIKDNIENEKKLDTLWFSNLIVDQMALYSFEIYLKSKENIIKEQQNSMLEMSTPVVRIWDRIILVPLIGMLDSARTDQMMETLLDAIEKDRAQVAILDISGIPIVDSLVANHLVMTVSAAKLMGSECIITGVSARISQTMVRLGIDLSDMQTRNSLSEGLKLALAKTNQRENMNG